MIYKAYDILVLVMLMVMGLCLTVIGFLLRMPGSGEVIWWVVVGLGILILVVGFVSIGFTATQATEMLCPYCNKKIVPRVKLGSGHLYLSTALEQKDHSEEDNRVSDENEILEREYHGRQR